MNKIYWMTALLVLATSCSDTESLSDPIVIDGSNQPVPLSFDSYAGRMITTRSVIETSGFGVYASYDPFGRYHNKWNEAHNYVSTPNYMFNTHVSYDTDHWTYSPLRYWPNEQTNNSWYAGTRTNTLTFFAYAPHITSSAASEATTGITALPGNPPLQLSATNTSTGTSMYDYLRPEWMTAVWNTANEESNADVLNYDCDPILTYKLNTADLTNCTDLLVGVVADDNTIKSYNGVTETPVTKRYPYLLEDGTVGYHDVVEMTYTQNLIDLTSGLSYTNMVKPALDTKLKFRFMHALTALRINVRADWANDDDTRITLASVKIGDATNGFYTEGRLNLRTVKANKPNWVYNSFSGATKEQIDLSTYIHSSLLDAGAGNPQPEGVRAEAKSLLTGVAATSSDPMIYLIPVGQFVQDEDELGEPLWENPPTNTVPLMTTAPYDGTIGIPVEIEYYATTTDSSDPDNSTRWHAKSSRYATLSLQPGQITTLTITISMDDISFDTSVAEWPVAEDQDLYLLENR